MAPAGSLLPLLPLALASACTAAGVAELPPPPDRQAETPAVPAARAAGSLAAIAGEWDIVEFDGHSPPRLDGDGQRHAFVDIDSRGLRFTIGCNYSGMPGSIGAGGVIVPGSPDDGVQTAMGCGPEREALDSAFFGFFRARPRVALLTDGRLRMEGSGHSLLLERADIRRLASGPPLAEITGTWRVVSFMHFRRGGHQGWGAMFAPGQVRIEPTAISYSRCPGLTVRFRYTADFTLVRESPEEMPRTPCSGVRPPPTEVESMLAALLGQSPHAERVPGGRYILHSRDYAVLLASEADYRREFARRRRMGAAAGLGTAPNVASSGARPHHRPMIVPAAAVWLALAGGAPGSVTAETIAADRYRLSTLLRGSSDPMDYADAQICLIREARRLCGRTGRPRFRRSDRGQPGRGRPRPPSGTGDQRNLFLRGSLKSGARWPRLPHAERAARPPPPFGVVGSFATPEPPPRSKDWEIVRRCSRRCLPEE